MRSLSNPIAAGTIALLAIATANAQTDITPRVQPGYKVPRTMHGHPDLQGTWTNATLTPVERDPKYGEQLVSIVLYGSAAVGDHSGRFSDINVFCVLNRVTPRELEGAEPILRWWRELGNPSPLLMRSATGTPIDMAASVRALSSLNVWRITGVLGSAA